MIFFALSFFQLLYRQGSYNSITEVSDLLQKFRKIQRVLVYILIINIVISLTKIIYGTSTGALSMIADGYHSLFDGVSNIIGLAGSFIAARPPDKDHPYGHQKYETIASFFIALLLIFVGVEIFQNAFNNFLSPHKPEVTTMSFLVVIGTMGVTYLSAQYEHRQGQYLRSQVLIADSMHMRSDIYISFSVIVSLAAMKLGFSIIDPIVALIISFIIFKAGYRIIKETSRSLLDMSRIEEKEICELVMKIDKVKGCHKIRTRGSMGDIKVDMHLLVQSGMSLEDAHILSHRVSKKLRAEYKDISDVVVHLEPSLQQLQELNRKKTS
jgi:cation diffusion facilitator family transporter